MIDITELTLEEATECPKCGRFYLMGCVSNFFIMNTGWCAQCFMAKKAAESLLGKNLLKCPEHGLHSGYECSRCKVRELEANDG